MHDLQSEQFLKEVNQIPLIPGYACVVCEQVEQEKRKAAIKLNKSLKQNALCALFKSLKDSGKCFTIVSAVLSSSLSNFRYIIQKRSRIQYGEDTPTSCSEHSTRAVGYCIYLSLNKLARCSRIPHFHIINACAYICLYFHGREEKPGVTRCN